MLLGASGRARRLPGALRKDKAARPAPRDSGCRAVQSPPGAEELHLDWQQRFETADIDGCGTAPCAGPRGLPARGLGTVCGVAAAARPHVAAAPQLRGHTAGAPRSHACEQAAGARGTRWRGLAHAAVNTRSQRRRRDRTLCTVDAGPSPCGCSAGKHPQSYTQRVSARACCAEMALSTATSSSASQRASRRARSIACFIGCHRTRLRTCSIGTQMQRNTR